MWTPASVPGVGAEKFFNVTDRVLTEFVRLVFVPSPTKMTEG